MSSRRSAIRRAAKVIGLDIAIFFILDAYFATILYIGALRRGAQVAWLDQLTLYLPTWCVLSLVSPGLFWLAKHHRVGLRRGPGPVLIYLAVSLAWLALTTAAWVLAELLRRPERAASLGDVVSSHLITALLDYQWFWLVVAAAHGYRGTRDAIARASESAALQTEKAQIERRLAQAELDALKAQLHPHFLFNTHHAIAGLIRANNSRAALELIANLSAMLRYALETEARAAVPLVRELEFVRQFLAIQAVRFSDRLEIEWDVSPDCDAVPVPPLILQPLIENAVHHGVSADRAHNFVRVRARRVAGFLELEIRNSTLEDTEDRAGFGIGLKNVHGRLRHLYGHGDGDGYELELELVTSDEMRLFMRLPATPAERVEKGVERARDSNLAGG